MAASTATSTSCGFLRSLAAIMFIVGFNFSLAQDNRFRINVYDDYQKQQQLPDYEDYQIDQNQNYQADQHIDPNYHVSSRQNYNHPAHQPESPNYQARSHRNQNYQQQIQDYPSDHRRGQNHQAERYQNQYQRQYQQRIEDRYKADYVKPTIPKKKPKKEGQDFSKIPGVPGVDFPIYHTIPKTSFSCAQVPYLPGMYANVEAGCQVYHVCHDGREGDQGASFLCSNGTLFNQNEFACDWWYNVKCHDSFRLYSLNGDATTNPFVPKAKQDEILKGREINEKLKIVVF